MRFRVFTEDGEADEIDSARIVAAGASAVIRLGWAVASFGEALTAGVRVDLLPEAIRPAVARNVAQWLDSLGGCRASVGTGIAGRGSTVEFLNTTAAAAWLRSIADANFNRSVNAVMPGVLRALAATWLDTEGRHVPSLAAMSLRRIDVDTASFALHTMGCIALRWPPRPVTGSEPPRELPFSGKPGPADIPSCVMLDPHTLRKAPLAALAQWVSSFPERPIGLEWYDGTSWEMELLTGGTVADRIEALRRMLQEPQGLRGLHSVEVDQGMLQRLSGRDSDAMAALSVQASWKSSGGASIGLNDVAAGWESLFADTSLRAKLLTADVDGGMTFLRYRAGSRNFYSRDGDGSVLLGRRLDAVPNPRLIGQIERAARRLRKEGEPLLEQVSGRSSTIFEGEIRIDYWRLSLPVGADGRRIKGTLVMTGGFQVSRIGK